MKRGKSTTKPTKAEQSRLDAIAQMPCIACEIYLARQPLRTEVHHIVDKGYRSHSGGHMATLPLCSWHHRGVCCDSLNARNMERQYGPSLELSKKAFVRQFGSERDLKEIVDSRLQAS